MYLLPLLSQGVCQVGEVREKLGNLTDTLEKWGKSQWSQRIILEQQVVEKVTKFENVF